MTYAARCPQCARRFRVPGDCRRTCKKCRAIWRVSVYDRNGVQVVGYKLIGRKDAVQIAKPPMPPYPW